MKPRIIEDWVFATVCVVILLSFMRIGLTPVDQAPPTVAVCPQVSP